MTRKWRLWSLNNAFGETRPFLLLLFLRKMLRCQWLSKSVLHSHVWIFFSTAYISRSILVEKMKHWRLIFIGFPSQKIKEWSTNYSYYDVWRNYSSMVTTSNDQSWIKWTPSFSFSWFRTCISLSKQKIADWNFVLCFLWVTTFWDLPCLSNYHLSNFLPSSVSIPIHFYQSKDMHKKLNNYHA